MSFLKKTWLARIGVGLNRFRMNNSTDVVLESNPVSVTQQGDQLSADNMNNLETRIDNAFTEMAGNLAPIEVSPATTNHAVGTQIVYNGILYKVISAISTDDNLVVGTNISPYPVSSAISDISDSTTTLITTGLTFASGVSLETGGYMVVGNLVFIALTLTLDQHISGLKIVCTLPFNTGTQRFYALTCNRDDDDSAGYFANVYDSNIRIKNISAGRAYVTGICFKA